MNDGGGRLGRRAVLLGGAALLAGCARRPGAAPSGGPAAPSATPASPSAGVGGAGALAGFAARLDAAVSAGDRAGFLDAFDPGLGSTASVLFANARALGGWTAVVRDGRVLVRTRAAGEPGWGSAAVEVTLDAAGRAVAFAERAGDHAVVWLNSPVRVLGEGAVAMIAAAERAEGAAPWVAAARAAAAGLAGFDVTAWRETPWDGSLVLELPADRLQFGEGAGIGAYVRLREPDDDPRIVCSPGELTGLDEAGRVELMTHEAVHAVTRSPGRAAPLWAIEGYAERLTERLHPALEARNAALLPATAPLPDDASLRGGDPVAYAVAALAVRAAQERWGDAAVAAWFADWAGSNPPPPSAFAAELSGALARR